MVYSQPSKILLDHGYLFSCNMALPLLWIGNIDVSTLGYLFLWSILFSDNTSPGNCNTQDSHSHGESYSSQYSSRPSRWTVASSVIVYLMNHMKKHRQDILSNLYIIWIWYTVLCCSHTCCYIKLSSLIA